MGIISSIGSKVASVGKKLGLKDYGITEALGGNKASVTLQNDINRLSKASTPTQSSAASTIKASSSKPTVLSSSAAKTTTPTPKTSTTSYVKPSTSYTTIKESTASRDKNLEKDTSKLFAEEQSRIAEAESRAAQERAGLLSGLDTAQQQLYDKLLALENPEAAYNRLAAEEGLASSQGVTKGLREQIDRVNKLIKGTGESVAARSMQSGLTEAQRQRLIASEQDPLTKQLADLSTGLSGATANEEQVRNNISNRLSAFMSGQDQSLEPLKQAIAAAKDKIGFVLPEITDRLSREITQYSTERQTRLDQLLSKYDRQQSLDEAEFMEASQLATQEANYFNQSQQLQSVLASANPMTTATSNVQSVAPSGNYQAELDNIFSNYGLNLNI